ncbi:MAG TPA: imidazoleglycerol-phosphate dehydratase HisB [Elusimicrobiota bacterium]|nr:imidazoleglycerol-phosphate dehydratase HisB [Elusimicrobiota bacterium]
MKKRIAEKIRKTSETAVRLKLNLDGKGRMDVDTSIPFLDHMLELFAKHGNFDLFVKAKGDTLIDDHHLVEDIGIVLGETIADALGQKRGITRYGQVLRPEKSGGAGRALTPMDETLSYVALDLSGRPFLSFRAKFPPQSKAPFSFELLEDFFQALAFNARMNLHIRLLQGRNNHHIAESLFKGFGRALAQAVSLDPRRWRRIPSTKGSL